jgi:serine/threonine-protein kinase
MVSRYRILRPLGRGGMGEVLLGQDTELDRPVAIKVMSAELAKDPVKRKRFRTEARAASGLSHPNICVIHEVGELPDGRPYLAMEYVEGQTLEEVLRQRRLKLREVLDIGLQAAEALEAAHARHIVHRDIKPSNLMLDRNGRVKVLDFGLAKRVAFEAAATSTTSMAHTQTGVLLGTPHYMSPEQALGREVDARTDIFSLGVVLYELVTGQRPFLGKTVGETINNVVNHAPAPLGLENPVFTPALDRIIFKCLVKDPAQRFASARELAAALCALRDESECGPVAPAQAATPASSTAADTPPAAGRTGGRTVAPSKLPLAAAALVGAGLVALGVWALVRFGPAARTASGARQASAAAVPGGGQSIAVLPFDNFSGEPDTDYLSDGLTEEITMALSRVPGLKVAARNSSFTFKGRKEDVRKVAAALRVDTVLEGSIRKAGKQLRVTAQLINARDGFHLWSETYDRTTEDILAVQEDIARRIAERLHGGTIGPMMRRRPVDPEAYKLYLQARQYWNKRNETALRKAVQLFQSAVDKDPTYAAAHAGLAATYCILPGYSLSARRKEFEPLARAAALRALELDASCAEAHAVLGNLQGDSPHWAGAEEHFQRAIRLDPNYATARHWYGRFLVIRGRAEEALAERRAALELDPLSPVIHTTIPEWYLLTGDLDRAISEARKVVEQFPDFQVVRHILIGALLKRGLYRDALAEVDKARALQPEEPMALLESRGYALARLGDEAEARRILALWEARLKEGKPAETQIAFIHLGLREYDKCLDALERLAAAGSLGPDMLLDPLYDELADLSRWQALLKKTGLKP